MKPVPVKQINIPEIFQKQTGRPLEVKPYVSTHPSTPPKSTGNPSIN